jgi:hypothetical protein
MVIFLVLRGPKKKHSCLLAAMGFQLFAATDISYFFDGTFDA